MKQAIKLGIKDVTLLEEIGDLYEAGGLYHDAG